MTNQPYQFLPPLSDAEYDALRADIAANGMRHPIIVDEHGKVLDGHHRAKVAAELGFKPEREVIAGLTEQEKRDLAFTLNAARRHMDQAQRRTAVIASLKADPQLSDRQHGRRTGVSHPTVASIRAELVAAGRLESLTSRIGADGRERPASRPQSPAPMPEPEPKGVRQVDALEDHPPRTGEADAPLDTADLGSAAVSKAPTGVAAPAGAGDPHRDGVGATDPIPGPTFGEVLDRLVPDDNPHREWQGNFIKALGGVNRLMLFTPAAVAEKADQQCLEELARLAEHFADWRARIAQERAASTPDNVTPIRRIS